MSVCTHRHILRPDAITKPDHVGVGALVQRYMKFACACFVNLDITNFDSSPRACIVNHRVNWLIFNEDTVKASRHTNNRRIKVDHDTVGGNGKTEARREAEFSRRLSATITD